MRSRVYGAWRSQAWEEGRDKVHLKHVGPILIRLLITTRGTGHFSTNLSRYIRANLVGLTV